MENYKSHFKIVNGLCVDMLMLFYYTNWWCCKKNLKLLKWLLWISSLRITKMLDAPTKDFAEANRNASLPAARGECNIRSPLPISGICGTVIKRRMFILHRLQRSSLRSRFVFTFALCLHIHWKLIPEKINTFCILYVYMCLHKHWIQLCIRFNFTWLTYPVKFTKSIFWW